MKKLLLFILLLTTILVDAQEDKTVTLTVSGTGKTLEEAKTNALRSAIEQAFGAFISSKTEILNDNLVKDEIVSVSNGNIQKYDLVSQVEVPNVGFTTIINAVVSVSKLTSFAQSKGVVVEIKGGVYAANIKQQILNETSEINLISQIFGLVHELFQNSFDFKINVKEPQSNSSDSQKWKIPINIESYSNENIKKAFDILINSLANVSLSESDVENYKSLGKKLYCIRLKNDNGTKEYFLRRAESLSILKNIEHNWFFYTTNFDINNNFEKIFISNRLFYYYEGFPKYVYQISSKLISNHSNLSILNKDKYLYYPKINSIIFEDNSFHGSDYFDFNLNLNQIDQNVKVITLDIEDFKTLQQLETLEAYKINSSGIISPYKYGGFIYEETADKFLIVSPFDIINDNRNTQTPTPDKYSNWIIGIDACKAFRLNNFNDWKAPSRNDLKLITKNLFFQGIGCVLGYDGYWSNEERDATNAYFQPLDIKEIKYSENRENYINSVSSQNKNNFYSFGLSLKMRPVRYLSKN
jgi:hypothetical protein